MEQFPISGMKTTDSWTERWDGGGGRQMENKETDRQTERERQRERDKDRDMVTDWLTELNRGQRFA